MSFRLKPDNASYVIMLRNVVHGTVATLSSCC